MLCFQVNYSRKSINQKPLFRSRFLKVDPSSPQRLQVGLGWNFGKILFLECRYWAAIIVYQENVYHQLMNSKVEEELIWEMHLFIRVELEESGF